ncbi:MAG: TolC family protein [Bacteroidales bacterium]|nr:TolC family protein [Bacteroidales bacterium]
MQPHRLFYSLLLTVALVSTAIIQVKAQEIWSLDSCRSVALANNKQMRIRNESIRMADYQKREAFAAYLPSIDFAGGYLYNQKKISIFDSDQLLPTKTFDLETQSYQFNLAKNPETGLPIKTADGQYVPETVALIPKESMTYDIHNVFFGAITLTQPIYMGGKIVAMNHITHYAEEAAKALRNNEAENVIYAVDAAYWQVVSVKAKYKLAVSYVALLDTLRQNVEAMVRQGVATRSDLLSVEVKLNSAEVDLLKVENGLVLSRMALAQVCGLPVDSQMTLADEDVELSATTLNTPIATQYDMADVYARRQDLRALEYNVKVKHEESNVARSSMLPNVALVGAWSFSNPNMFDGFKKRFEGAFSVGAMVTIPIWHWGGNYNKYRAAKSQITIAQLELEDARTLIDLQVSQSAFRATEALKTYIKAVSNIASADENLRSATLGFREGVMTTDNVMEAQTAWLKAYSEKIDAAIDVHLCDVYLSKVLGQLTPALSE